MVSYDLVLAAAAAALTSCTFGWTADGLEPTLCEPLGPQDASPGHDPAVAPGDPRIVGSSVDTKGLQVDDTTRDGDGRATREVPRSRPRLLATPERLPELRARLGTPDYKDLRARLRSEALRDDDGVTADGQPDEEKASTMLSKAIVFELEGDPATGRSAVDMVLGYLGSITATYADDGLFVSRAMNYHLMYAAVVYDWCYELFTPDERAQFVTEALRIAGNTEDGWPLPRDRMHFVNGHYTEEKHPMMLALGIAIYDEDPSVYDLMAHHLFSGFAPVRNFYYQGHRHHQGSAYGPSRFSSEVFSALFSSVLDTPPAYVPEQGQVPYFALYNMMPHGYPLPEGDDYLHLFGPGRVDTLSIRALARIHHDGYLQGFAAQYSPGGGLLDLFYADPDLAALPIDDLPLTRHFGSPFGTTIARTGWDLDGGVASHVAVARMHVKEYVFGNHDHLDAGHFSLYYKGGLAIDSGSYDGSDFGSAHHFNYNQRTIAHNTITVFDPDEPAPRAWKGGPLLSRDGGQVWPLGRRSNAPDLRRLLERKRAEILAQHHGPDPVAPTFSYLKGDIGPAYAAPPPYPAKVERALRSFVFIQLEDDDHPAALVVYDVVTASDPAFVKRWLLHSVSEPDVVDDAVIVTRTDGGNNGKMINHTLLPRGPNRSIRKVGGPGREFLVDGRNYPFSGTRGLSPEAGAWRIELSPVTPAREDRFLNVMQVSDALGADGGPGPDPLAVDLLEAPAVLGVTIGGTSVLFSRTGDPLDTAFEFDLPPGTVLVTDLSAGAWCLTRADGSITECVVSPGAGTCVFDGPGGTYQLTPTP